MKIKSRFLSSIFNFLRGLQCGYLDFLYLPIDLTQLCHLLPSSACCICKMLDSININYYVTDGTVLGIYRDGCLIGDHDLILLLLIAKRFLLTAYLLRDGWRLVALLFNFHIYDCFLKINLYWIS